MRLALLLFGIVLSGTAFPLEGASYYRTRLDDPKAVYLTPDQFPVHGDGRADDSQAVQAAIDRVQESRGEGIVFVPQGRYLITQTIYVWPGIRVIGYGEQRPVFLLADKTTGFQQGMGTMFFFTGSRTRGGRGFRLPPPPPGAVPGNLNVGDANSGTFYSAMTNIDFEIGNDNAAAVAVRFHVAQHGYLAHMNFHVGSGLAALNDIGNLGQDLHFFGGRYGILTRKPSPAWQYTLIDSTFDGQREAAIRENEAQLTVIHCEFRNVPTAISIDKHYSDQLWVKDSRFENISGPAIIISNENSRMTQINVESVDCRGVPVFARFRESGHQLAGAGATYRVRALSHGLTLAGMGALGEMKTAYNAVPVPSLPPLGPDAMTGLPPMDTWVNVRSLGLRGDGVTDDTAALQKAIAEHKMLYFPTGNYVVRDTIALGPDTVLVGLHPDQTQIDLLDSTPGFQGPGAPKPLLLAPRGGRNMVTGIGLYTGGINSRAVGALWMAGKESQMDDVRFLGGHGTTGPNGKRETPYNGNLSGDPDPRRQWDSQYPSLWITHGGGGTFSNLWTPSTFAQAGLYISDTTTPGRVYQVSSEHHVRTEVKLDQVENWELYALQTEGERGESESASSLEISRSKNVTIANFHAYRVVRSIRPFPYAIRVSDSSNIRFRNIHADSNSSMGYCPESGECRQYVRSSNFSYGTCIFDPVLNQEVRDREFAFLDATGERTPAIPSRSSTILESGAGMKKLAAGFFNISGAAVDAAGRLYFVDQHWHRIYRWTPETQKLAIVRDNPLNPVNLVFDKAGNLIVVSSGGSGMAVYSLQPDGPEDDIALMEREPAAERPQMNAVLPVSYWVNGDFTNTLNTATYEYTSLEDMFLKLMSTRKTYQYVSRDRKVFIPEDEVFAQGPPHLGYKWAHTLQAFGLVEAAPGRPFYVTNESEQRTYRGRVNPDGTLSQLHLFTEQGGESLAQDSRGNVWLAAGQVFVFNPDGKLIETVRVPERPLHVPVFRRREADARPLLAVVDTPLELPVRSAEPEIRIAPGIRPRHSLWMMVGGGAFVLFFWAGWAAALATHQDRIGRLDSKVTEIWGDWLHDPEGMVLCFSNPLSSGMKYLQVPLPPDTVPKHVPLNEEQSAYVRQALQLHEGGYLYLGPGFAQAKMGEAVSAGYLSALFARAGTPVKTTQSRFVSWDDLPRMNLIVMGSDDVNRWVDPLLEHHPFRTVATSAGQPRAILNTMPEAGEKSEYRSEYGPNHVDLLRQYVLISMVPGVDGQRKLLLISGLGTQATQSAAEFLTTEASLGELLAVLHKRAPGHAGPWRFQALLSTEVHDKVPTKATMLAVRVLN